MKWVLGFYTTLVYLFMYLPIAVIILFSFSQSEILSLPISGWTFNWYHEALQDDRLKAGLANSLKIAFTATALASILGTLGALAVQRYPFFGRTAFRATVILPILLPGIITGVAMLSFFATIGLPLGLMTVIIGHTTFGFPIVFNTVASRLARLPKNLEEAAADLGANPRQTFQKVLFPSMRSAIIAGALLAFTLSFDEIIVTLFLTGQQNTLPTEIWARLRFGMTPEINATVTMILILSCALVIFSQRFSKE
ncbi:MAG: ABC transporter permease [Verrucomicrobiae bacterium]|nr:ABC transporter permease [Verrucomicrobiae bacterium]